MRDIDQPGVEHAIQHADSTQFTLITDRGLVKEANPLLQARAYALEIGAVQVTCAPDPDIVPEAVLQL